MTEIDVLNLFQRKYGRTYIYADEFNKLTSHLGFNVYIEIYRLCKLQGHNSVRTWLACHDMYRDTEKDMRPGSSSFDSKQPIDIVAAQIIDEYALIGEAVLADETLNLLFERAQQIFDEILEYRDKDLNAAERDIMTLAIIQYLKRRSIQENDKDERQIWSYIYNQFGFKTEQEAFRQRVYNSLCMAVRGSLLQHGRFFSEEENTQRYYNTLNLHAMTPVKSMESLFEILLSFYIHDLEFNYTPGDLAFSALVKCIAYRWDRDIEPQEDLTIRSNPMTSGLRTLFTTRPCFMQDYCERIVRGIDALVRGNDAIFNKQSTLDALLCSWYARKDVFVRDDLQKNKQNVGTVRRIADPVNMLRIRYALEHKCIYLTIPSIRLEEKADDYPVVKIYQQDICIVNRTMEVFGRYSWTTQPMKIALDTTDLNFNASLELSVQIEYAQKTIVHTENKLHRSYILFDENGQEASVQDSMRGIYYIFSDENALIEANTDNIDWLDHSGQLLKLYIDDDVSVCVNGEEIAVARDRKDRVRFYPSISPVEHLSGMYEGQEFAIYPQAFSLNMRLPEGKSSLSFRIEIDGKIEPLVRYCSPRKQGFVMDVPSVPEKMHLIRMIELETGRSVCTMRYAILPDVKVTTDRAIIYEDGNPIKVQITYTGCSILTTGFPEENSSVIMVSAEHLAFDLKAEIPLIFGTLDGQNIFDMDTMIWCGKFSDTSFAKIHYPKEWKCRIRLGEEDIPQNAVDGSYEVGNALRAHGTATSKEPLVLTIQTPNGSQDMRILSQIVFEEHFMESPVSVDGDVLMWNPTKKYIGGEKDEFFLSIDIPLEDSPYTYALDMKDTIVSKLLFKDFPYGEFPYRVTKQTKRLFGAQKERLLWEGTLVIGEPEQWALEGKALYLTRARCWDLTADKFINIDMPQSAGCLIDFKYIGYSVPSGEEIPYPEYEAVLYFYDLKNEQWHPFNDFVKEGYECINPVHIWIINPKLLMLATVDGEPVILDRKYNSIMNRTLYLPREVEKYRLILPDYFEYNEG